MAGGWIKLHRSIQDNELWLSEPFTKAQAWIDLLLLADSENNGKYKRGNVYRGKKWLAERWGWSMLVQINTRTRFRIYNTNNFRFEMGFLWLAR